MFRKRLRNRFCSIVGACLGCAAVAAHAASPDITALAEDWAPYNFVQRGEIRGIATDLLREMCAEARLDCSIDIVPWARAYETARRTPSTLVFTTARLPERESSFIWIGPFLPRDIWAFGLRERALNVTRASDLNRLRVGVVNGDAAITDLAELGVAAAAMDTADTYEINLRKFVVGRVDVVTGTEVGLAWGLRSIGASPDLAVKLFPMSQGGGYYFAVNPKTPEATVKRLRDALATLQGSKRVSTIVLRYTDAPRR